MKFLYLLMCMACTVLPLSQFVPWLAMHGLDMPLLVQEIVASRLSAFAWLDVLVSGAALIAFVLHEGRRLQMPRAWMALLGLSVGVSLALPLFLLMRECHLEGRAMA